MAKKKSSALHRAADYDLKKSKQVVGPLLPILKDKNGRLLDGFHRLRADKNWPTLTIPVEGVKSDVARIVVNIQRRRVPRREKTRMLKDLAEKTGWTAEEIADKTGMSVSWVRKYLPSKYKDREMAKLAEKKHRKGEKSRPIKRCPNCGNPMIPVFVCSECDYMGQSPR